MQTLSDSGRWVLGAVVALGALAILGLWLLAAEAGGETILDQPAAVGQ